MRSIYKWNVLIFYSKKHIFSCYSANIDTSNEKQLVDENMIQWLTPELRETKKMINCAKVLQKSCILVKLKKRKVDFSSGLLLLYTKGQAIFQHRTQHRCNFTFYCIPFGRLFSISRTILNTCSVGWTQH